MVKGNALDPILTGCCRNERKEAKANLAAHNKCLEKESAKFSNETFSSFGNTNKDADEPSPDLT